PSAPMLDAGPGAALEPGLEMVRQATRAAAGHGGASWAADAVAVCRSVAWVAAMARWRRGLAMPSCPWQKPDDHPPGKEQVNAENPPNGRGWSRSYRRRCGGAACGSHGRGIGPFTPGFSRSLQQDQDNHF